MKYVEHPYFSLIIPCYNSKKTIARLLNSVVAQNMAAEIQVILADDHSTESYDDEIRPFYDKLCIERIMTDYNCCPGNTREKGTTIARGEWLVFADHDDTFLPNTFREVQKQIRKNEEPYIAYCNIYRAQNTTGKYTEDLKQIEMTTFTGLLHGKFFNRENFWNKFDIHFKKDMFTHEDTYVTSIAKCVLNHLDRDPLHIDIFDYVWFNNSKSLSNANGVQRFLEDNFCYFVEGTSEVYREYYNKGFITADFAVRQLISSIVYDYFYMQLFLFHNPSNYVKSNAPLCRNNLKMVKQMFNLTNADVFWYCGEDNAALYSAICLEAGFGYIPTYSFYEWLNVLDKDKEE